MTITRDRLPAFLRNLETLLGKQVMVGIPNEKAGRNDGPLGNAEIGYLHENGSPAQNIPARPFLVPGAESVRAECAAVLRKAAAAALAGQHGSADAALVRVGLIGVRGVQRKLTDGPHAPLARATIAARARRGRKGAKKALSLMAQGKPVPIDLVRPLIDTGQLRRSISFVIRKAGRRKVVPKK